LGFLTSWPHFAIIEVVIAALRVRPVELSKGMGLSLHKSAQPIAQPKWRKGGKPWRDLAKIGRVERLFNYLKIFAKK
jgi:hypothetical protein